MNEAERRLDGCDCQEFVFGNLATDELTGPVGTTSSHVRRWATSVSVAPYHNSRDDGHGQQRAYAQGKKHPGWQFGVFSDSKHFYMYEESPTMAVFSFWRRTMIFRFYKPVERQPRHLPE
jgi:hypothetical protein